MRSTREAISLIDINEFVLDEAPRIKKVYLDYLEGFENLNSVWISKYEEMIGDFAGWLLKACRFLEVENPAKMLEILKGMQSLEVSENNYAFYKHKLDQAEYEVKTAAKSYAFYVSWETEYIPR